MFFCIPRALLNCTILIDFLIFLKFVTFLNSLFSLFDFCLRRSVYISIVKILNLYIILLCTHLYHSSFQYLSITFNAFIACYIRHKKYSVSNYLPRCTYHLLYQWLIQIGLQPAFHSHPPTTLFPVLTHVLIWINACRNDFTIILLRRALGSQKPCIYYQEREREERR